MALPIVVVVLIAVGLIWRARVTRRLTIEESVDRYRRTLSAVHEASARSRTSERAESTPSRFDPPRFNGPPRSRRALALAVMALVTVAAIVIVVSGSHDKSHPRTNATTTTRPRSSTTHASTTTTAKPSPTTTIPLVRPTGSAGTSFTISKASYTLAIAATTGACWVDARDPEGKTLFAGVVAAGQSQAITAGTVSVQLGNPAAVAVTVEGTPVPFTIAPGNPVTLQFSATGTAA